MYLTLEKTYTLGYTYCALVIINLDRMFYPPNYLTPAWNHGKSTLTDYVFPFYFATVYESNIFVFLANGNQLQLNRQQYNFPPKLGFEVAFYKHY